MDFECLLFRRSTVTQPVNASNCASEHSVTNIDLIEDVSSEDEVTTIDHTTAKCSDDVVGVTEKLSR